MNKKGEKIDEKERYNEKTVVKQFLMSEKGITFLIDNANVTSLDQVIDYYGAWAHTCPARKFYKNDLYGMLKIIEKHANDDEVKKHFSYLFN